MLGDVFFFDYNRALQTEPVGGEGGGDSIVGQAPTNLWDDGNIVKYSAQNGLVVLDAGVCDFLALLQETLHMFCVLCERTGY